MSTDFSIRPVGVPAPSPVVQPVSQAASNGVATELPASQSVTAADAGAAARNDVATAADYVSHQAFFDRSAASMVFQVVDSKTEQVVDQFPDEAMLRRKAYFHTLDMAKDAQPRVLPTDRVA
jgi:uncharacterized FlaG/YvyC family protein